MAYQLKSNPLENNPLFGAQPEPQPESLPEPAPSQPAPQKSPQKSAKKSARKPSGRGGQKNAPAPKPTASEPAPQPEPKSARSRKADNDAYTRATFIVRRDLLGLLKDYAYTERREIKDVINEILADALAKIEADYAADGRTLIERE